jgi:geranylgeranyl pyrophosphate synthase
MLDDPLLTRAEEFARYTCAERISWRTIAPAFEDLAAALARRGLTSEALLCIAVPRAVYIAAGGKGELPDHLAIASLCIHTGSELLDDLADGQLSEGWPSVDVGLAVLTSGALIAGLAPLALQAAPLDASVRADLSETLARGLLTMIGGQATDISHARSDRVTSADAESALQRKSGGTVALYAELAARAAGAESRVVRAYARFGRWLGSAAQLRTEYWDIFRASRSVDLTTGTRTLPVAMQLDRLDGADRERFLVLLNEARAERVAQIYVRSVLREGGVLGTCLLLLQIYCERARSALASGRPREPGGRQLHAMIAANALLERAMVRQKLTDRASVVTG